MSGSRVSNETCCSPTTHKLATRQWRVIDRKVYWDSWSQPSVARGPSRANRVQARAEGRRPIRRALVSVYDKTDLTSIASALVAAGVEIVSTGSTAATITAAGLPVTPIEELTGFPECLDGRVKTLHPRVHAGLLADVRLASHRSELTDLGIEPFEL